MQLCSATVSLHCSELNGKLETYAHACQSIGIDINWDNLSAEPSSERLDTIGAAAAGPSATSAGITAHPLSAPETASAIAEEVQTDGASATNSVKKVGGGSGSSGSSAEPGSAEAAVEALAAAMPLRLSGLNSMIRTSTQDRKGEEHEG